MLSEDDVLAAIDAAFGGVRKPEHFTDHTHCEECAEHDETLRTHDRGTLRICHVGNAGWDPLCFTSPQGKAYYMPTLARLALAPAREPYGWYGEQLLFHLYGDGADNAFVAYCNAEQRRAVAGLLAHFVATQAVLVDSLDLQDALLRAHGFWSNAS